MKVGGIASVALSIALVTISAGCSSDASTPTSTSTSPAQQYDTFEKIGDGIGCLSLANSEPETTDIKENKYCTLEHPKEEGGSVTIYQYADVARRDKSLRAGLIYDQNFLVLSDTWAITGDVRDLRKIKAQLGIGDLRSPKTDPSASSPTEDGVGPGDKEDTLSGDGAKTVPFGKSATYHGERVQVGKVYCNSIRESRNPDKPFNSCRLNSLTQDSSQYDAPKGRQYFVVAFRWKNVSKAPLDPSDFGTVVTSGGVEYAAESSLSNLITSGARGNSEFSTGSEMNPGTTGRILLVYTIPRKAKVVSVHWGLDDYSSDDPAFALRVK